MTTKKLNVTEDGKPVGTIEFTFVEPKEGVESPPDNVATFDLTKCNEATVFRLALHGASQKIGDSYASAGQSDDPVAYAKLAVKETIEQLYAGEWRATSSAGPRVNDLATAMARASGQPLDQMIAAVAAMDDDQKKVYRKKPKIAAALAAIAAEKAIAKAKKLEEASAKADADAETAPTA